MIDLKLLKPYAHKYQIDEFTVLREYLQLVFLNAFFGKVGSHEITFKGGTALRLAYGSPRFSEDLDFNCRVEPKELKVLLEKSVSVAGRAVPDLYFKELETIKGYSAKLYLKTTIAPMPLTVKLDFSFREQSENVVSRTIATELPVQSFSLVPIMSAEEILAEKMRTIFQRKKGRDVYDIWYLLNKKIAVDLSLVNRKMALIGKEFAMGEFLEQLDLFNRKSLEGDLFKFLPHNERSIVSKLPSLIKGMLL
ncbi:MAG: nucleotidyl transferase AbiEii/AbiGii toxin family protein [bacterium]